MTPTSFAFTLSMAGDARFVGAIRLLAAQAASYAQLPPSAGEALAGEAERATESAIAIAQAPDPPIEVTFSGDEQTVTIVIACTPTGAVQAPAPSSGDGVSVTWQVEGSRLICHIRQPTAA